MEHGNEYPSLCHKPICSLNHYLLHPITLPSVDIKYYYWKLSNTVRTIIVVINYIISYGREFHRVSTHYVVVILLLLSHFVSYLED